MQTARAYTHHSLCYCNNFWKITNGWPELLLHVADEEERAIAHEATKRPSYCCHFLQGSAGLFLENYEYYYVARPCSAHQAWLQAFGGHFVRVYEGS